MTVLGVIPARGGSKGIPGKNIQMLRGKPVLQYTIEAARASRCLSRVILTTDSQEIARLGSELGVEVPFMRPPELAEDDTPMVPVLQHAVGFLEEAGDVFNVICLLQPTSPLRRPEHIDACYDLMVSSRAESVLTTLPVPHRFNPHWLYFETGEGWLSPALTGKSVESRQQLPPCFQREGSVYLVRRDVLMRQGTLFGSRLCGLPVDPEMSVNLDGPEDWERARVLLTGKGRPAVPNGNG